MVRLVGPPPPPPKKGGVFTVGKGPEWCILYTHFKTKYTYFGDIPCKRLLKKEVLRSGAEGALTPDKSIRNATATQLDGLPFQQFCLQKENSLSNAVPCRRAMIPGKPCPQPNCTVQEVEKGRRDFYRYRAGQREGEVKEKNTALGFYRYIIYKINAPRGTFSYFIVRAATNIASARKKSTTAAQTGFVIRRKTWPGRLRSLHHRLSCRRP